MDETPPGDLSKATGSPWASRLLSVLQRDGPLSAEALAARMGLSRTAVARQLRTLGRGGLVVRGAMRHGVGRPRHLYDVTPDVQTAAPEGYERLVVAFLEATLEVGGTDLVARIFEARRRADVAELRAMLDAAGLRSAPLAERVRGLAAIADERGYLADVSEERGLRLVHHGCPVLELARKSPMVCDSELRVVGQVLGALVERESNIASGARACVYRIRARDHDFPPTVWTSSQMRSGRPDEAPVDGEPTMPWTGAQWAGSDPDTTRRQERGGRGRVGS
jgi:predicted ArsR family transcriptional regulator